MTENDTIMIMRAGKQTMIFPGKGGYKISCSPGTRFLPMDKAQSGHLVIEGDHFQDLNPQSSDAMEVQTTFVLDHTCSFASSSATQGAENIGDSIMTELRSRARASGDHGTMIPPGLEKE